MFLYIAKVLPTVIPLKSFIFWNNFFIRYFVMSCSIDQLFLVGKDIFMKDYKILEK